MEMSMRLRPGQLILLLPALLLNAPLPARGAGAAAWHHGKSPLRAVFNVTKKAAHAKAGTAVSVPVCGMGHAEGGDFFAFDENGAQLPLFPLGRSVQNQAIALVQAKPATKNVFVYFGSKTRAPVHRKAFLPSLTLDVRTVPDGPKETWRQVENLIGKSERLGRIFVDKIELSHNPVDSTDAIIMIFQGYLNVAKAGAQTFMLVSDDSGYLFIDGKMLVERPGRHYARDALRGESRAAAPLSAGPHEITCVVVDYGGAQMAVVARWVDGRNKHVLRANDFIQPGKTRLVTVEARGRNAPNPVFWSKPLSYMSYKGAQYTEVELGTYNKAEAEWRFGDGSRFTGAAIKKVVVGLETQVVQVMQKRVHAEGVLEIPEAPPRQRRMAAEADFKHYSALMLKQSLRDLNVSTLRGCIHFLEYRELNEDTIPFYDAILKKSKLDRRNWRDALTGMARAAARDHPDKSAKAYQLLFKEDQGKPAWEALAREYAEFVIFRERDFELAAKTIERMAGVLPKDSKTLVALRLDLALQKGEVEEARQHTEQLLSGRELGQKQRYAVVKSNALRQRFYDLLQVKFILDARKTLGDWAELAPADRLNGSLSLARSRLWQELGWLDGALGELDGAILMDPLLPNLPDVELERALIHQKSGNQAKANEIFLRIVKEFPNHPAADRAKESVK